MYSMHSGIRITHLVYLGSASNDTAPDEPGLKYSPTGQRIVYNNAESDDATPNVGCNM